MSLSFSPTPDSAPKGNLSWLPTREDTVLILESSGEAMFVTDRDGRILSLNPVAQQLVGVIRMSWLSVSRVGGMPFFKGGNPSRLSIGTHRTNR